MTGGSGSGGWSDGDDDDWGSLESAGDTAAAAVKPAASNDLLDFGATVQTKTSSNSFDVSNTNFFFYILMLIERNFHALYIGMLSNK